MRRNLRGTFWLAVAVLWWLSGAVRLVPVMLFDWITGCINRKFDALFKDF